MKTNSFIADYEIIREIMHAILRHGTLTPDQMPLSDSKYNKIKPLLEAAMQDNMEDRRYQNEKARSLHITADTFSEGLSSLCNTYMMRSLKVSELVTRLLVLQLLQSGKKSINEIVDGVSEVSDETQDDRTIKAQIKHLAAYGQVTINGKTVALPDDVFAGLTQEDITQLTELVSCLRHFTAPSLCGEQLFHTLCDRYDSTKNHFLVTGLNTGYVLDDAVLYDLLTAIEQNKIVSFDYIDQYHEKPDYSQILPLMIHSADSLGRRYLVALNLKDSGNLILCRLDFIKNVEISKENGTVAEEEIKEIMENAFRYSIGGANIAEGAPVPVRMKYDAGFEPELRRRFPDAQYIQEDDAYFIVLNVNHPRELKAFLREHADRIQAVPDDSNTLYNEMQEEAKLWRSRYGIES